MEKVKERMPEARAGAAVEALARDLRYGVRALRKKPAFTVATIATLALVIGANTAIFSAVYGLVFRRLPYKNAEQLVMLWDSNRRTGLQHLRVVDGSFPVYEREVKSFQSVGGFLPPRADWDLYVSRLWGTDERVFDASCTSQLFGVLGVQPILGRGFLHGEDSLASVKELKQVAVLSYSFWRRHYGGSPDAIGKILDLSEFGAKTSYTIVGVMPEGFDFPYPLYSDKPDIWTNLAYFESQFHSDSLSFDVLARLRPGVSLQQAQAELGVIAERLRKDHAAYFKDEEVHAVPLQSELIRNVRTVLWVLLAALGGVILIGCANAGTLLLVRAMAREREIAVRAALGASRATLARQILTETALLGVAGGALGLLVAYWGLRIFLTLLPPMLYVPRFQEMALDPRILIVTAVCSMTVAVVFGVLPSLRLVKLDLSETIKSGQSGSLPSGTRFGRAGMGVLVFQISLALVLMTGTALLARSLQKLLEVNGQYQPEHLVAMEVAFSNELWSLKENPQFEANLVQDFMRQVGKMKNVRSVSFVDRLPLFEYAWHFRVEGSDGGSGAATPYMERHFVSASFFDMMGYTLLGGRWFADIDRPGSTAVAVINQAAADRYWRDQNPVGQKLSATLRFTENNVFTIVGIVREPARLGNGDEPKPAVYFSELQSNWGAGTVVVRTAGNPRAFVGALREAALNIYPGKMIVGDPRIGSDLVSEASGRSRFMALLLSAFSGVALLLALTGIYGLISHHTAQRTREMGIRMAMGATPGSILQMVMSEGMRVAVIGLLIGGIASYAFARSFRSLLYEVPPADAVSFVISGLLIFFVAAVGCYFPARRAMRVDPMSTLRQE